MSVQTEITRLTTARNSIRDKLVTFGVAQSSDDLTDLSTKLAAVSGPLSPAAQVREGETYTITPGYYSGGSVTGIAGGGQYSLQAKTVTPTTAQQAVAPDEGYYGLSGVTVNAIPSNYKDVTNVTAVAGDVLTGKTFVNSTSSSPIAGTMANNGHVSVPLDTTTTSYIIPAGYHDGAGGVYITTETKTATPAESSQTIEPTAGKVLSSVTVNAIPAKYADTSDATVTAAHVLAGDIAYGYNSGTSAAVQITGTMVNRGAVSQQLDTDTTSYTVPAGYHNGLGTVSINTETKSFTPTAGGTTVVPSDGNVLSSVTVNPIPATWGSVAGFTTSTTASAATVLSGKKAIVLADGVATEVTGTMANRGAFSSVVLDADTTSATVNTGYYSAGGTVSITPEQRTSTTAVTPSISTQSITPTAGKVLTLVTVNPIPSIYKDTTGTDAVAANILDGKKAVTTAGLVEGSMTNNGAVAATLTGLTSAQMSYTIPAGYHNGSGTVTITNDIENALAAI